MNAYIPKFLTQGWSRLLCHPLKGNIFVMTSGGLGGGSEDGFRKLVRFAQSFRQCDTTNAAAGLVFLPGGAGNISPDDALDGDHVGTRHQHRTTADLIGVR